MTINLADWILDIDLQATMDYSAELYADHCECGYCRNYYSAVRTSYPALEPMLTALGVNIESPVDFLPVEPTLCIVSYAICGEIRQKGREPIELNGLHLFIQKSDTLDYTLSCQKPYFVVTTEALHLPWLLDEDENEVVSPANEPECLERMWRKLLNDAEFSMIES